MSNDQNNRRTALAIFAIALIVALIGAFVTTFRGIETRTSSETQAGTVGRAHPHPPLDIAPGEPLRN